MGSCAFIVNNFPIFFYFIVSSRSPRWVISASITSVIVMLPPTSFFSPLMPFSTYATPIKCVSCQFVNICNWIIICSCLYKYVRQAHRTVCHRMPWLETNTATNKCTYFRSEVTQLPVICKCADLIGCMASPYYTFHIFPQFCLFADSYAMCNHFKSNEKPVSVGYVNSNGF